MENINPDLATEESPRRMEEQPPAAAASPGEEKAKAILRSTADEMKKATANMGSAMKRMCKDPLVCNRALDAVVDWLRSMTCPELFDEVKAFIARAGHVALVVAAPVGLAFALVGAVKDGAFSRVIEGVGFVLLLIVLQYLAEKFMAAGETLTLSLKTNLNSDGFLRCTAWLSEIVGFLLFVWLTVRAIQDRQWSLFWRGAAAIVAADVVAYIALHPSLVSTTVSENRSAGEEGLGIISFFVKCAMRMVPIVFAVGAVVGTLLLFVGTVNLLRGGAGYASGCAYPASLITGSALLPLGSYVAFAVYALGVELCRAILSLLRERD